MFIYTKREEGCNFQSHEANHPPEFRRGLEPGDLPRSDPLEDLPGKPLGVLIIGGGQAGLALGYHLQRAGLPFLIVDAAPEVGHAWRSRYDSLKLFTPAKRNALPGLPFPAAPEHYPSKDEVADYLAAYAQTFDLPLKLGVRATSLTFDGDMYTAHTSAGTLHALQVVIATGPFGTPWTPDASRHLTLPQLHSSAYRRPAQLPPGEVLVVGSGNSGAQIAEELTATHPVTLALGRPQPFLPQCPLHRDIFDWAQWLRILDIPITSPLGRKLRRRDPVIGTNCIRWRNPAGGAGVIRHLPLV